MYKTKWCEFYFRSHGCRSLTSLASLKGLRKQIALSFVAMSLFSAEPDLINLSIKTNGFRPAMIKTNGFRPAMDATIAETGKTCAEPNNKT